MRLPVPSPARPIVFVTGAGISAASGIPTFRGPEGYWTVGSRRYQPQEMATQAAFRSMPRDVWRWYLYRRGVCRAAEPNAAHHALVTLERELGDGFRLVTQNVDGLHARAGHDPSRVAAVHGDLDQMRDVATDAKTPMPAELVVPDRDTPVDDETWARLVHPETAGRCRPHVLWFDEYYDEALYQSDTAITWARTASTLVVVGTSGAARIPWLCAEAALLHGAVLVDVNPDDNPFRELAAASGDQGFVVPADAVDGVARVVAALGPRSKPGSVLPGGRVATKVDLCVIGGGPAGFAASSRAWDLGRTVALVERARIGGAALHNGALSSKTMWEIAKDYATACRTDRGYRVGVHTLSFAEVVGAVRGAVFERRGVLEHHLDHMGTPSPNGGCVLRFTGEGRITGDHRVTVTAEDGVTEEIEADAVLICTGSSPRSLPDLPADGRRVVTSDHVEELDDFPRRLLVIGAGVVGCEYATIFARFGKTEVHLVDRESRILPFEDADVSEVVSSALKDMGLRIHHRRRVVSTKLTERGVDCVLDGDGGPVTLEDATVLLSIGRVPNTRGLGLEERGVELLPSGAIKVEDGRSSVDWIWAAGDTTADIALVNVAELEGRHVVETLFGANPRSVPYDALSTILFVQPEVAAVGLNEQQAQAKGIAYRAGIVGNAAIPRAVAMRATSGFVKLLAAPDGRLLGLRVVGPQASSTIQGCALLIANGGTIADIDACIHPHPAIPEGVQEAARLLLGRSVLKPGASGSPLQVRSWPEGSP